MSQGSEHLFTRAGASDGLRGLPRVHLASRSPRRRELLTSAGIEHDAASPGVDDGELSPGGVDPEQWVMALAYLKAAAALRRRGEIDAPVVLGADTIVLHRGEVLGQPKDAEDARRMLVQMRSDEHDVLTGVALIDAHSDLREMFVDRALVSVGEISDEVIERYVASGEWRGKAGAYNLSERLAAGWPITYRGDAGTIMGLPVGKLVERLRAFAGRAA